MSVFWFFSIFPFSFFFLLFCSILFRFVLFCFYLFTQFLKGRLGISMALLHTWLAIFSLRTNCQLAQLSLTLCSQFFQSGFLFLSTWLCFEIFILMGRILIRVLNFSLQTKSNPRIIYFCKIFNSPTGNYPKRMLNSPRIVKGVHSYW